MAKIISCDRCDIEATYDPKDANPRIQSYYFGIVKAPQDEDDTDQHIQKCKKDLCYTCASAVIRMMSEQLPKAAPAKAEQGEQGEQG